MASETGPELTQDAKQAPVVLHAEILVLGAGYGGLHVVQSLSSALHDVVRAGNAAPRILVVDRRSYHQLTTELPRLVSGHRADADVDLDLERLIDTKKVRYVQAEVSALDPASHRVDTNAGPIGYAILVIALGSVSNDFGIPGVREHMRQFLTTSDARNLRIAAARIVEDAARIELEHEDADQAALATAMTVVIAGAGPTGVEVAGELAEFMADRWQSARRVAGEPDQYRLPKPRIVLIDASSTILRGWSDRTIAAAMDALTELGVEVRVNAAVERVEPGYVHVKGCSDIRAGILVWAGGVRAPDVLAEAGLPTGAGGRVQVDPFERVSGVPDVWVVGDSALLLDPKTGRPVPPTADLALRGGETAAGAILARLRGEDPARVLSPLTRNAVSVGQGRGAANLLGIELRGRPAHALKDLIEWEYRQAITRLHGHSLATVV